MMHAQEAPTATTAIVWIVDDDPHVLEWIQAVAESVDLEVRGFQSPQEFLAAFNPKVPGCVVSDLRMPRMSGLELQHRLGEIAPHYPLIMISAHGEVAAAVRAMKQGAVDFLEKPFSTQSLIDRLNEAIARSEANLNKQSRYAETRARYATLTDRERGTLEGVVQGKANKVIAIDLDISEKTVEDRRARVMRKMGANSVAELTRMILEADLMPDAN